MNITPAPDCVNASALDDIASITATPDTEVELFTLAGRDGYLRQVNEAFPRLLGRNHHEVEGRSLLELVHPADVTDVVAALAALESGALEVLLESRFCGHNGSLVHLQWVMRPVDGSDLWWAAGRDITQFRIAIAETTDLHARLDLAVGALSACAWEFDIRTQRFAWDDVAPMLLMTEPDADPATLDDLVALAHLDDRPGLVTAVDGLRTVDGAATAGFRVGHGPDQKHLSLRGKVIAHDHRQRPQRAIGMLLDVTAEKAMEEQLMRMVMSDALTGIANRRAFDQALRNETKRCRSAQQPISVLMIDVDDFKGFNDTFGHLVGDAALCAIARTLQNHVPTECGLLARFGGEEFAVVLPGANPDQARHLARQLVEAVATTTVRQAPDWQLSISAGIATTSAQQSQKASELIAQADTAMYKAKAAGKNRYM